MIKRKGVELGTLPPGTRFYLGGRTYVVVGPAQDGSMVKVTEERTGWTYCNKPETKVLPQQ